MEMSWALNAMVHAQALSVRGLDRAGRQSSGEQEPFKGAEALGGGLRPQGLCLSSGVPGDSRRLGASGELRAKKLCCIPYHPSPVAGSRKLTPESNHPAKRQLSCTGTPAGKWIQAPAPRASGLLDATFPGSICLYSSLKKKGNIFKNEN